MNIKLPKISELTDEQKKILNNINPNLYEIEEI